MNSLLGHLQDERRGLRNAKVQPMIMVFDSKARQQKPRSKPKKPKTIAYAPVFAFINVSRPGAEDEDSRRLIKTHVMQDVLRRAETQEAKNKPHLPTELSVLENEPLRRIYVRQTTPSTDDLPQAPPSNLVVFPVEAQPYMRRLIHNYAVFMLPVEAKAEDSAWFPLIMTDAALFHALLCTSALLGNSTGISYAKSKDSLIQRKHMLESIRLINARLLGDEATSDATITAILFMAKAEYLQGNHHTWSIHMNGIKRIVELRGGITMLSWLIQHKIYATDLLGCVENGAKPHFPIVNLQSPMSSLCIPDLPPNVTTLVEVYTINKGLLNLLGKVSAYAVPQTTDLEIPSLYYRLLSFYFETENVNIDSSPLKQRFQSHPPRKQQHIIEESLLVGALLYLSLPHLRTVLPAVRPINYEYLLGRLEACTGLLFDSDTAPQHSILLLWLSFLGEIFSSSPCAARYKFRPRLRAAMADLSIRTWEDMTLTLRALWWIEPMYDEPYRQIWEEICMDPNIYTAGAKLLGISKSKEY